MTDNYTPFEYMHRLMTEMDEMMTQMRQSAWDQGWDQQRARPMLTDGSHADATSSPARWQGTGVGLHMNVESDEDGYTVVADIPGFETDELKLRFDEDERLLRITGSHEESTESSIHSRRISEQTFIPGDATVRVEDISATYRNGVLEVRLPTETTPEDEEDGAYRIAIED